MGKEVVGIEELGTASGASQLLAGSVLGAAANVGAAFGTSYVKICADRFRHTMLFKWEQLGSTRQLVLVAVCWFRDSAY